MVYRIRRPDTPSTVTGRLFAVLQAFTPDRPALTLAQISRLAGLPSTTTGRMLTELTASGFLDRGADLRYRIGYRLRQLAQLATLGWT